MPDAIGALTELAEQSGGGLLFDSLAECRVGMERLRAEPGLRDDFGARGRQAVAGNWTVDVPLERYLRLIESLIAKIKARV